MSLSRFLNKAKKIEEETRRKIESPHHEEGHDESNWLISYADMMTLLCAFFIMMFSLSSLNASQFEKVKKEVTQHLGGEYKVPHKEIKAEISQILTEAGIDKHTVITSDTEGVTIIFQSTLFFDSLSAYAKPQGRKVIETIAKTLIEQTSSDYKNYKLIIEGHTDSQPIISGNYATNWELSSARANHVLRLFLKSGFNDTQLTAVGLADTRPLLPNRTPSGNWNDEAMQKNRRVVVRIFNSTSTVFPWETH